MIIYVHKVRSSPENGWGQSAGMQIDILGRFSDKEKAIEHKAARDANKDAGHCDVGNSWIEEEIVQ